VEHLADMKRSVGLDVVVLRSIERRVWRATINQHEEHTVRTLASVHTMAYIEIDLGDAGTSTQGVTDVSSTLDSDSVALEIEHRDTRVTTQGVSEVLRSIGSNVVALRHSGISPIDRLIGGHHQTAYSKVQLRDRRVGLQQVADASSSICSNVVVLFNERVG